MPAGKLIPVRIGDVDVYVETMPPAPLVGSEQTAFGRQRPREGEAVDKVADVFARAQDTILSIAFSAEGHIVVAKATAEASLKVTLTYTRAAPAAPSPPTTP